MILPFPSERLRRVLIAAVDDDLEGAMPSITVAMDAKVAVRYGRASRLAANGTQADLWITNVAPSAPDRTVLFETLANQVIEQDEDGAIWVDESRLRGRLVRVGRARDDEDGPLQEGDSAGLLLASRDGARCIFSVEVTLPILWVYSQPRCLSAVPVLLGWTGAARWLWHEREAPSRGRCDSEFPIAALQPTTS